MSEKGKKKDLWDCRPRATNGLLIKHLVDWKMDRDDGCSAKK